MAGYAIAEDNGRWKSEFAKPADKLNTLPQAMFGTRPAAPSKPVGEKIGAGARVVANGASSAGEAVGRAARSLENKRQSAMTIANNIPGAIAAPIANAVDSFGAAIRTGYTGKNYVGREFVGKPMFDGSAQAAAPTQPGQPVANPIPAATPRMATAQEVAPTTEQSSAVVPPAGTAMPGSPHIPAIGKDHGTGFIINNQTGKRTSLGGPGDSGTGFIVNDQTGERTNFDSRAAIARGLVGGREIDLQSPMTQDLAGRARQYNADADALMSKQGGGMGEAFVARGMRNSAKDINAQVMTSQGLDDARNGLQQKIAADLDATKLKIAADLAPKAETAYDKERTRGAKMDNDRAAIMDGLLNEYMNAPDDKTRNTALERLNALGGKNNSDKYITIDVDTGQKDAMGNPIYVKAPFNTRTGEVVSPGGAAASAPQQGYPEGTRLTGADGKAYIVKGGKPVLVQ